MKKLFTLFLMGVLGAALTTAKAISVTFVVDDPARVKLSISYSNKPLQAGNNVFDNIGAYSSISLETTDGNVFTSVTSSKGNATNLDSSLKRASFMASSAYDGDVITISSASLQSLRTERCIVNIDSAALIKMDLKETTSVLTGLKNGRNEIFYAPGIEKTLRIYSSAGTSVPIYKVSMGDTELTPTNNTYLITLPATADINVQAAFPDVDCALAFNVVEGGEGFLSKVTVGTANGAELDWRNTKSVKMGTLLYLHGNATDYKLNSYTVNDTKVNFTSPQRLSITGATTVAIDARKWADLNVIVVVDNAANVKAARGKAVSTGTPFDLVDGENRISVRENANQLAFADSNLGVIEAITHNGAAVSKNYTSSYPVDVAEGSVIMISTKAIERDLTAVVYVKDLAKSTTATFGSAKLGTVQLTEGYNTVKFGSVDNPFSYKRPYSNAAKVYHNGTEVSSTGYVTATHDINLAHGSVVKIYVGATAAPAQHIVTLVGNVIGRAALTTDRITPVTAQAQALTLLYGTELTVDTKQASDISVIVDNVRQYPDADGKVTVIADADKTVTIDSTNGVENIAADSPARADVYTATGVCVLRNASTADMETLPAGLYFSNGKKIVIRR